MAGALPRRGKVVGKVLGKVEAGVVEVGVVARRDRRKDRVEGKDKGIVDRKH